MVVGDGVDEVRRKAVVLGTERRGISAGVDVSMLARFHHRIGKYPSYSSLIGFNRTLTRMNTFTSSMRKHGLLVHQSLFKVEFEIVKQCNHRYMLK